MYSRFRSLVLLVIVASCCELTTAQVPDPSMDPTVWQKLGIRNAIRRFQIRKDAFVNKKGNNPQFEKKPKLLKLADPKLLELPDKPEFAAIKAAAEIKFAEDLAPQKIKAIKYLASLGCGCRAEIAPALLEGLKDCNADVRKATVEAIMTSAGKMDECKVTDVLKIGKRIKNCNECGNFASGCSVCGACCSAEIQDQLKKMAEGQKKDGCFVEPDPAIRDLAMQALSMCPPAEGRSDKDVQQQQGIQGENPNTAPGENGADMTYFSPQSSQLTTKGNATIRPTRSGIVAAKPVAAQKPLFDRTNMIIGRLSAEANSSVASIKFADALAIPENTVLTLMDDNGRGQHVRVYGTDVGRVEIQTFENEALKFGNSAKVWVGIQAK